MNGLDILGAVSFEEYIVGATTPDETPVLAKLNKAAQRVSRAASKIPAKHGRAAAKLKSLSSTAIAKGQKLKAAITKAKAKAQSTLAQPKATPTVAKMAQTLVTPPPPPPARTTSLTTLVTPTVAAPVRAAATYAPPPPPPAPVRAATTYVAPAPTRTIATSGTSRRSAVGYLSPALLASVTDWIKPMLDIYSAFADQLDDAGLAAEIYAQVAPLVDQLTASVPSSPLIASGNAILDQAATLFNSVAPPPDPNTNVGMWLGDFSSQGADLQRQAIDWIKAARDALATGAAAPGTPPPSPTAVAKISVTPISTTAVPGQPVQFFAQTMNAAGQTVTPAATPTWAVTPATGGATVDQSGNFNASAAGSYTVTVTADGFSASGTVYVQGGDAGYGGGGGGSSGGGGDSGYGGDDQQYADQGDQSDQGYDDQQYADQGYADDDSGGGGSVFDTLSDYVQQGRGDYADEGSSDEGDYPSDDYPDDGGDDSMMLDDPGDDGADLSDPFAEVGHGGGGHGGGHGGHGGGGRGMRYGGGGWYGPWYVDSGYDVLLDYDNEDDLADRIAKKVAQRKWAEQLGYTAPETHWYTVATPSAVKDEMDKIMREGNTLDQDINSTHTSDPSYPAFTNAWQAFWLTYKKFYDDNATGISGWASRLWSSTGDQIVDYGNQLNDWRARLRQFAGARVTEPAVTSIVRRDDPSATNWKPYVIGFGVLAGLGLVSFGAVKIAMAIGAARKLAHR